MTNAKWIKKCQESLKNIDSFKPGNRVQTATQLVYLHNALYESMVGWAQLLNKLLLDSLNETISVKAIESPLTDEDLKDIFKFYKEMVKSYLEYDIKITSLIDGKIKKKTKKGPTSQPPDGMII